MTSSQQRVQNLLNKITSSLEDGYFHRLLKIQRAEKLNVKQEIKEKALAVQHDGRIDFVPGIFDSTQGEQRHAGMPVYADLPNVDSVDQLDALFRVPEDYDNLTPYSGDTLSSCYTSFGKQAEVSAEELLSPMQDDCLVQLTTGEIKLMATALVRGCETVAAILSFPQHLKSFCIYTALLRPVDNLDYEGEVRAMHLAGMFSDCPNLQFIAAIPEGVRDLQFAFQNCPKLNCPIHIPSTVTRLYGMLNDCESFSASITVHTEEKEIPGIQSLPTLVKWSS